MTPTMSAALICVVVALSAGQTWGGEESGGQAGAFLRTIVGARAAGMGGAFTAVADDHSALCVNPAGLAQVRGLSVGSTYSLLTLDRGSYEAGIAYPMGSGGTVGLLLTGFGVQGIDGRDADGFETGDFSDTEMAVALGYAHGVRSWLSVGASGKYIYHGLADNSGTGFGFDVGAHSCVAFGDGFARGARFGIGVSNLGASLIWDTESTHKDEVPVTVRLGMALDMAAGSSHVVIAVDGERTDGGDMLLAAGTEAWLMDALALRCGVRDGRMSAGLATAVKAVRVDYAWCDDFLGEGAVHRFGVAVRL